MDSNRGLEKRKTQAITGNNIDWKQGIILLVRREDVLIFQSRVNAPSVW